MEPPTVGTVVAATAVVIGAEASKLHYVQVSAGEQYTYLVRSDGKIDRSTGGGKVSSRLAPEDWPKVTYTLAACGMHASYMIRSDGSLDRYTSATKCATIRCPDGARYVWASCSDSKAYVLRDDGVVDVFKNAKDITAMPCPDGAKYVSVNAGINATYLTRDDGKIDRTTGSCKVSCVIVPEEEGVTFLGVSEQVLCHRGPKGEDYSNMHSYFIRSDGAIDRTHGLGKVETKHRVVPTSHVEGELKLGKYVSASATATSSYFVRADGTVDRYTGPSSKMLSMVAPQRERATIQAAYVQVSAHNAATYLLRDDGLVDRTTGKGAISCTLTPTEQEPETGGGCAIM